MPKIVISDIDFEDTLIEEEMAREAGIELSIFQDRDVSAIARNAADADGIVTSYGDFSARAIAGLNRAKCICKTGTGVDNIDVAAATEAGIAVCNVPGYGTEVVSDHAIMLALGVLRRINELDHDIRQGTWDYSLHRPFGQVKGRVFGVVGMGNIGRAVARKAAGMGFKVICCSRSLEVGSRTKEGYEVCSYEGLLRCADIVSFHVELVPETHHMLDVKQLSLMKSGAIVVNTSRGAVVDTVALAEALEAGRLWGAGIDVFENEPVEHDHPLLAAPHTLLSAHAAYWSEEAGEELRRRCMQNAIDVVSGRRPASCVNPEVLGSCE